MTTSPYTVTEPAVLWQAAAADLATFRALCGIYLEQAPPLLQRLRQALAAAQLEQVVATSHALKGMAGLIGAGALAALLQQIEREARAGLLPAGGTLAPLGAQVLDEVAHSCRHYHGPEQA